MVGLGTAVSNWAAGDSSTEGLVLIGSQLESADRGYVADVYSDWDFQVITSCPERFLQDEWCEDLRVGKPILYVAREGRLGSSTKISALFAGGMMDLVILPVAQLHYARDQIGNGRYRENAPLLESMTDLAAVLRNGFKFLKGAEQYRSIFDFVVKEISPRRISDDVVRQLANGFACDYLSTRNKISRGELLAAQRWIHLELVEKNFRLLHELRLREGKQSYPDARRLEFLVGNELLTDMKVEALPNAPALNQALEKCRATLCVLVEKLIGAQWTWPELPPMPER